MNPADRTRSFEEPPGRLPDESERREAQPNPPAAGAVTREVDPGSRPTVTLGGEAPKIDPEAQAMIVKVTGANVGPGITAHLFYFAPGKDGARDDFGLILDAEPATVAKALPQYAQPKMANGYRRELTAIGDPDGSGQGKGKSLLVCRGQKT